MNKNKEKLTGLRYRVEKSGGDAKKMVTSLKFNSSKTGNTQMRKKMLNGNQK